MNNTEWNEETSMDYVRVFSEMIGPRPAGSPAERQALDYLTGKLMASGYEVVRTPVAFAPQMLYSPFYGLGALLLIIAGFLLPVTTIPALLLPFINLCLPQFSRWLVQSRKTEQISENLIAEIPGERKARRLILCAHVDTGKVSGIEHPGWIKLYQQCLYYGQRIAIFLFFLALAQVLGVKLPEELFTAIQGLVLILGSLWFTLDLIDQLGNRGVYAPGANDNASGMAVALEAAQILAKKAPKSFNIAFLFTGAEESGLYGAQEAARQMDPSRDLVLNLDMVGSGDRLYYVTADGTLSLLRTDSSLNQVIRKAEQHAHPIWYTVRSGDFAAFLRRGIRAASLEIRSGQEIGIHYHTRHDRSDLVLPETLAYMNRFLKFFLAFFEDELIEKA